MEKLKTGGEVMSLLEVAQWFERFLVFDIKRSLKNGDDEGVRLKEFSLSLVRAAIKEAS